MKVFEIKISIDDYNYVEGILELRFSGNKLSETKFQERFSVDSIHSTKLIITKKYIAPTVPDGISRNHLFSLRLPFQIPTFINDSEQGYNVNFDEVIVDDQYVSEDGFLIIERYNTLKEGNRVYSTCKVKVYGLKKNQREEVEKITKFELFKKISGKGTLQISPLKEYYDLGEQVSIKAVPDDGFSFKGWKGDFQSINDDYVEIRIENDVDFEAQFTDIIPSSKPIEFMPDYTNGQDHVEVGDYSGSGNQNKDGTSYQNNKGFFSSLFDFIAIGLAAIWYLFLGLIFIAFIISLITALGWFSLAIIGFFLSLWLIPKLFSFIFRFDILRGLISIFFIFIIGAGVFNFFSNINNTVIRPEPPNKSPETEEEIKENSSTDYVHLITWQDYDKNEYSTYLRINSDIINYESLIKESFPNLRNERDYYNLLQQIYLESDDSYYHLYKSLDSIRNRNNISYEKFPEVVVSMVQSIPYFAIIDDTCNPFAYQDESMRELLNTSPCQGFVKHGIKTPAEFLKDLKGDCDTRTLFIYGILRNYKYDVAIFGSEKYKHSLLGINLNGENDGVFKKVDNKKYYLWETTNMNYQKGVIPNTISNVNYWDINLK